MTRDFNGDRPLGNSVIALPLLETILEKEGGRSLHDVVIDLNLKFSGGRALARKNVETLIRRALKKIRVKPGGKQGVYRIKSELSEQYVFARLRGDVIQAIVAMDEIEASKHGDLRHEHRSIYRIWPDFVVSRLTTQSYRTVKADAAQKSFSAFGDGIVWAVLDSGIDAQHPHFRRHANLDLTDALLHCDFTSIRGLADQGTDEAAAMEELQKNSAETALRDDFGHGTHVAGIIAGALEQVESEDGKTVRYELAADIESLNETGAVVTRKMHFPRISGMAPLCKILSLKVLDEKGRGSVSNLIAALEYIHRLNGNGRRLLIHGVNLSVGYDFDPKWFACGQSPLCVEVDRLVRSGVVVVAAAGNTGYGWNQSAFRGSVAAGQDLTINDPGNAESAITVGSTHRDMPHLYGVSFFSSKGPTGDGRMKPDLVAPGEKIVSCAAGKNGQTVRASAEQERATPANYRVETGTSMAAPHVSGVIAAFLSIRREFIGKPKLVKEIFMLTATDLGRTPCFQGRGVVDLMRAIQHV